MAIIRSTDPSVADALLRKERDRAYEERREHLDADLMSFIDGMIRRRMRLRDCDDNSIGSYVHIYGDYVQRIKYQLGKDMWDEMIARGALAHDNPFDVFNKKETE